MQTQPTTWFNKKTMKPVYGIKVKHEGRWMNAADDNGPLFFDTEEERDIKRAELRKQRLPIK